MVSGKSLGFGKFGIVKKVSVSVSVKILVSSFSGDRCANDCDADEVQDAEDENNEDGEDLDDDKVDDVVAEMMVAARKWMTRNFDDVH